MFDKAGIPAMAIDIPMPNAIYFGANNYTAGVLGGEVIADFAVAKWRGRVDRVLLLEVPITGHVPHSRVIGALDGIRGVLPHLMQKSIYHKNSRGTEEGGYAATLQTIRSLGKSDRLLVATANDETAKGAIRAIRESRRGQFSAVIAQGWGPDELLDAELKRIDTPLIGAVSYFPEKYGANILVNVLDRLNGKLVPPSIYIDHHLLLRKDISRPVPVEIEAGRSSE